MSLHAPAAALCLLKLRTTLGQTTPLCRVSATAPCLYQSARASGCLHPPTIATCRSCVSQRAEAASSSQSICWLLHPVAFAMVALCHVPKCVFAEPADAVSVLWCPVFWTTMYQRWLLKAMGLSVRHLGIQPSCGHSSAGCLCSVYRLKTCMLRSLERNSRTWCQSWSGPPRVFAVVLLAKPTPSLLEFRLPLGTTSYGGPEQHDSWALLR